MTTIQEARVAQKPVILDESIPNLLNLNWNMIIVDGSLKNLDSYDDANFYFAAVNQNGGSAEGDRYLLKFYNAIETKNEAFLEGLSKAMDVLSNEMSLLHPIKVPLIVPPISAATGKDYIIVENNTFGGSIERTAVRIFRWIDGMTLSSLAESVEPITCFHLGNAIGRLQTTLQDFDHPSLHRFHLWDLQQFIFPFTLVSFLNDSNLQTIIESVKTVYEESSSCYSSLPGSIIMGDANDANIVVQTSSTIGESVVQICGIIDFSDLIYTWRINEIAIALAYGLVTHYPKIPKFLVLASIFLGYLGVQVDSSSSAETKSFSITLTPEEISLLPLLMATRLSVSVMVGAYTIHCNPQNEYLLLHAMPGRKALTWWWTSYTVQQHQQFFHRLYTNRLEITANHWIDQINMIVKEIYGENINYI
jgi:hydroxylysine kinase